MLFSRLIAGVIDRNVDITVFVSFEIAWSMDVFELENNVTDNANSLLNLAETNFNEKGLACYLATPLVVAWFFATSLSAEINTTDLESQ